MQFLSKAGRCLETEKEEHCTTEKLRKDTLRCTCMRFVHIAMPSEALFFSYWILTPPHGAWESMHFVTHIIIHYPFLSLIKKTLEDENTFHRHWEIKITQRISHHLRTLFLMCDTAALLFSRLTGKVKGWTSSHFANLLQRRHQDPMT